MCVGDGQQLQPAAVVARPVEHADLHAAQAPRIVEDADDEAALLAQDAVEGADGDAGEPAVLGDVEVRGRQRDAAHVRAADAETGDDALDPARAHAQSAYGHAFAGVARPQSAPADSQAAHAAAAALGAQA